MFVTIHCLVVLFITQRFLEFMLSAYYFSLGYRISWGFDFCFFKITAVITQSLEFTRSCYHIYQLNKAKTLLKKVASKKTSFTTIKPYYNKPLWTFSSSNSTLVTICKKQRYLLNKLADSVQHATALKNRNCRNRVREDKI